MSNVSTKKLKKDDRRVGVKPSAQLAKKIKNLFATYLVNELALKLEADYKTLKKIENRESVKQSVIDFVEARLGKLDFSDNEKLSA